MECGFKGALPLVHQEYAVKCFNIKGSRSSDCRHEVLNLPVSGMICY